MDDSKTSQTAQTSQTSQTTQTDQVAPAQGPVTTPPKVKEGEPGARAQGTEDRARQWAKANEVAKEEGDEYWENYAREIELEKEIMEIGGIEKIESGEVKIDKKLASEMGVKPTVEPQTPMASVTGFTVRGKTLSDDQITLGLKKPTSTGLRWLVEWFIYQLLRAHFHIKRIGGKILRVKD